jgi:AmiR/NasT family two-component response regulator
MAGDGDMDKVEHMRSPVEDSRATPSKVRVAAQPSRVLVADDEHLVARGLAANLSELGYNVIGPASDGEEAIELSRIARPDLAILDIRMPKRDGLSAGELIFSQLGIPVIIISAYSDPEYLTDASRIGVFGYLLKPVSLDQLRTTISIAWGRFVHHHFQDGQICTLRTRLEQRKMIEQAKWLVVKRKGLSEPEAMKLLQRQARDNRKSLADVARGVIDHEDMFGEE